MAHTFAGYNVGSEAFIERTFTMLGQVLPQSAQLHTERLIVESHATTGERHFLAIAKNGM